MRLAGKILVLVKLVALTIYANAGLLRPRTLPEGQDQGLAVARPRTNITASLQENVATNTPNVPARPRTGVTFYYHFTTVTHQRRAEPSFVSQFSETITCYGH